MLSKSACYDFAEVTTAPCERTIAVVDAGRDISFADVVRGVAIVDAGRSITFSCDPTVATVPSNALLDGDGIPILDSDGGFILIGP